MRNPNKLGYNILFNLFNTVKPGYISNKKEDI
jgi:hypothetical protein